REEFRASFSSAARQIFMLMTFAGAIFFMCSGYIARVMLIGASSDQVDAFANVLQAYSVGLVAYSLMFVAQRAFYAISDAKTPFYFMSAQLVTLVLLTLTVGLAVDESLRGVTYAAIWSITTIAQMFLAYWLLRRRLGNIGVTELVASGIRYLVAIVPAFVVGFIVMYLCNTLVPEQTGALDIVVSIVFAFVVTGFMGLTYFGALLLLKAPEAKMIASRLRR
ncbi:MAG: lipid II flippase MurJ, partial [Leucobacter sp.]